MPWQFYPLPFLMRLIFLLRARVTRANGCFELEHPRCRGLRDSHMRDDVRRDANENSDTRRYVISGTYRFSRVTNDRSRPVDFYVDISRKRGYSEFSSRIRDFL